MTNAKKLERFSQEEEQELLQGAGAGNREAMEKLYLQYRPLLLRAAHQPHLATVREDAESVATESFLEAVHSYDAGLGVSFAAYAKGKVFGDVRTFFRRERARWQREFVPYETENGESVWDELADPARTMEQVELAEAVGKELERLSGKEREVIECLMGGRMTQMELARKEGVSFQCITKRKKMALRKLEGLRRLLKGR